MKTKQLTTTVRLSREGKAALDQLQARVTLEIGERVSLEDLLQDLVELGSIEFARLVAGRRPVDDARIERLMGLAGQSGAAGPFRAEDIDRDLYGM